MTTHATIPGRDARGATDRVVLPRTRETSAGRGKPPRRRRRMSAFWQWVLLILLGALLGVAVWIGMMRTTVTIVPPLGEPRVVSLRDVDIPIVAIGEGSGLDVEAVRINTTVTVSEVGEALTEVPMPDGRARGTVRIINLLDQDIPLPAGTEFIGSGVGNEVRLMLDAPAVLPRAVTTSTLTSRTTEYGQIEVAVTARSAGSASNVAENQVTTLLLPGQGALASNPGQIIIQNAPISGGSETVRRIVSEDDVSRLLGNALAKAYAQALMALQADAQQRLLIVDATTMQPSLAQLGDPQIYGVPRLEPAVGAVLDPASAEVRLTVQVSFRVYAIKADQSVQSQIQRIVPQRFQGGTKPTCVVGELPAIRIDAWRIVSSAVRIDGTIACAPQMPVDAGVLAALPAQLVATTPEQAAVVLDALQAQGVISDYQLPTRSQLPPLPQLITIRVGGIEP